VPGYTLTWHPDAIDDVIGLALSLDAQTLKLIQDNVPLLLDEPRPANARRWGDLPDTWTVPVGAVQVDYEIIADSAISVLRVRPAARR
jgi:hypothetical protein